MARSFIFLAFLIAYHPAATSAQVLTLKEAVNTALDNYATIKAKGNYVQASRASASQSRRDYLPNLNISAQQDYGTVNGQNGPLYGFGGLGVASSGIPLDHQNWNAAFGALYLANLNWDFFAFGRAREKIKVAESAVTRDESDLQQERFQHEVRVASAYLNLLAAQRIIVSQQKNLERADALRNVVVARAKNGLIAGVDSSQANAEISNARIALTRAKDVAQEQANQLSQLMGVPAAEFVLDSFFISKIPASIHEAASLETTQHPLLKYFNNRIAVSNEQVRYFRTFNYPAFTFFSIIQTRGSGFSTSYTQDQTAFSHDYLKGIEPSRSNYLLGIGATWNLTSPLRINRQVRSQQYISRALQDEYELTEQRLKAQLVLAGNKMKNALDNYNEMPLQLQAASDAYLQKSVLYRNGLTNIVDLTQTLYALNRAETDRDIIYNNVWQALLLKAAAAGDFGLFINEF
jgi:outer membrane protein TolC